MLHPVPLEAQAMPLAVYSSSVSIGNFSVTTVGAPVFLSCMVNGIWMPSCDSRFGVSSLWSLEKHTLMRPLLRTEFMAIGGW